MIHVIVHSSRTFLSIFHRATVVKDMNNFWAELPHTVAEEGV